MATVVRPEGATLGERSAGPGALLTQLFEAHGRTVYALCAVLLRDAHEAEDAAQQTFLSAYEALADGSETRRPDAWLLAIARNECLDRLRRRTRRPEAPLDRDPPSESADAVAERNASVAALCAALKELPDRQREALLLHEVCDLGYEDVARVLGTSRPAVESLIHRARRELDERRGSIRILAGALVLPLGLREEIARAIPGFSSSSAGAGAGAGAAGTAAGTATGSATGLSASSGGLLAVTAKVVSMPLAAKIAATAILVAGAGSTIGYGVERVVSGSDSADGRSVAALLPGLGAGGGEVVPEALVPPEDPPEAPPASIPPALVPAVTGGGDGRQAPPDGGNGSSEGPAAVARREEHPDTGAAQEAEAEAEPPSGEAEEPPGETATEPLPSKEPPAGEEPPSPPPQGDPPPSGEPDPPSGGTPPPPDGGPPPAPPEQPDPPGDPGTDPAGGGGPDPPAGGGEGGGQDGEPPAEEPPPEDGGGEVPGDGEEDDDEEDDDDGGRCRDGRGHGHRGEGERGHGHDRHDHHDHGRRDHGRRCDD